MRTKELQEELALKIASQNKSTNNYDAIVIGVGSMGSSTCYYLAKQGYKVLGIEQFNISHENGSHAGQSRLIRKAYFELTKYVPLLESAYQNWHAFENEINEQLYYETGLLYAGRKDHFLLEGVKQSSGVYNVPLEEYSNQAFSNAYKQFTIPENFVGVFEPEAGFITPERAILHYVRRAMELGANIHTNESVINWTEKDGAIEVNTSKGQYSCKKLVLCCGAWLPKFIPKFKTKLKVTRQLLAWVEPKETSQFQLGNFPCWNIADPNGHGLYYGFPILPEDTFGEPRGLKIAHHFHGDTINPDQVSPNDFKAEEEKIKAFCDAHMPEGFKILNTIKKCMYTNTADEHFIIDLHPENNNIVIAGGFSGHGFKFVSVIGEILTDLVSKGKTDHPIEFLAINRLLAQE